MGKTPNRTLAVGQTWRAPKQPGDQLPNERTIVARHPAVGNVEATIQISIQSATTTLVERSFRSWIARVGAELVS